MARGQETGSHPNRQVHRDRWQPTSGTTGPMGSLTGRLGARASSMEHETWQTPEGRYVGGVQHTQPYHYGGRYGSGVEVSNYTAGPFRTERRAQIASEALGNRVERGIAERHLDSFHSYSKSSYYHDD